MAKKKKEQKKTGSVDFPKAKKKLGKKSPQNNNLTNISFKTKGLYVPTQSILEEKTDKPTTTKKQTLESLLVQVKHYNYNIRKEALLGICELIEKHSSLLVNYLGNILHTTIELVVDEENAVRSTLRKLNTLILESVHVNETSITPFLSYIMVYIGSGLTHLTQSIRIDTMLLLNVWVKQVPSLIAQFYTELFPCFLRLLTNNVVTGSRKSLVSSSTISSGRFNKQLTSFETRMVILDCLYSYISCLFKLQSTSSSSSTQLTQNIHHVDYNSFNAKCNFSSITKHYYLPFSTYSLNDLNKQYYKNENAMATTTTTTTTLQQQQQDKEIAKTKIEMEEFIEILIPILIECWLECSPSTQSISSDQSPKSLQYMKLIAQIIDILLGYSISNCSKEFQINLLNELCSQFNKQLFVYFPFTSVTDDVKISELILSINVSISSILSYYIISQEEFSVIETYTDTLCDFIDATFQTKRKKNIDHFTTALIELLFVVERLITQSKLTNSGELLQTVSLFTETLTISSLLKHHSLQFQCKLFKLAQYRESLKYGIDTSFIKEWLNKIPKLLWEINTSNITLTELLIDNLINIGIHNTGDINLDIIQPALIPYVHTFVKKSQKHVFGPFTKLPNNLQLLFVNLLYYLPSISTNLLSSLLMSIPKLSMGIVTAIIEILSLKLSSFEMINFLVSSIVRISTMRNLLFDNILTIFDTIISVLLCTIDAINKINLLDNLFKEILISYDNEEDKKVFIYFLGILSKKSMLFNKHSDLLQNQHSELSQSLLNLLEKTPSIEAPVAALLDTPILLHILAHISSELNVNNVQVLLCVLRCPLLHNTLRTHKSILMSLKLALQSIKEYNKNAVDAVQEISLLLGNQ